MSHGEDTSHSIVEDDGSATTTTTTSSGAAAKVADELVSSSSSSSSTDGNESAKLDVEKEKVEDFSSTEATTETATNTSDNVETKDSNEEENSTNTKKTEATKEELKENENEIKEETIPSEEQAAAATNAQNTTMTKPSPPIQSGPFIDLFGDTLLALEMVDETHAQMTPHYTNDILDGKKVVGLYFSADWCGPCRQFTPELVSFYNKMNKRRGRENQFEIVWISRCRDVNSFGQYFTHMKWLALPPTEAMGQRGQFLSNKYKVKGIPSLVLLDEVGGVITTDARNKLPQDKAGIGFPWRSPIQMLYTAFLPKSLRIILSSKMEQMKDVFVGT
eukprot:CAMPEP_0184867244 /NCGR_PEP_ID=MMETSP0580-20130426/25629_1 /TAXON_ID=1118495 /ORGANISM="Dactyliosolen fragilissimus" /LENGTH=332 /DNA_ID=CAMNT_0027367397 /DNA_START=170 /DNA_END=1165 /DNA_ORIENTATION=-